MQHLDSARAVGSELADATLLLLLAAMGSAAAAAGFV
jgi:hypothetical protein